MPAAGWTIHRWPGPDARPAAARSSWASAIRRASPAVRWSTCDGDRSGGGVDLHGGQPEPALPRALGDRDRLRPRMRDHRDPSGQEPTAGGEHEIVVRPRPRLRYWSQARRRARSREPGRSPCRTGPPRAGPWHDLAASSAGATGSSTCSCIAALVGLEPGDVQRDAHPAAPPPQQRLGDLDRLHPTRRDRLALRGDQAVAQPEAVGRVRHGEPEEARERSERRSSSGRPPVTGSAAVPPDPRSA